MYIFTLLIVAYVLGIILGFPDMPGRGIKRNVLSKEEYAWPVILGTLFLVFLIFMGFLKI